MSDLGYILGTVGYAEGFSGGKRILNSTTLLSNSLSFSVSPLEIRAGENNGLIGTLFMDPNLSVTLEDATFKLEYLALKTGSPITMGSTDWKTEQVTTTEFGKISVKGTPVDFGGFGKVGFYKIIGESEEKQIEFDGKIADVADLPVGTSVCVKYNTNIDNAREIKIASNFVPSELYLLVHTPMFAAGQKTTSSQKLGEVVIEIPRFLVDPTGELSLTSNGTATVPLSGSAQVSYDSTLDCSNKGFYGRIKEIIFDKDILDDAESVAVEDSNIELSVSETQIVHVLALFGGLTIPKRIDNSKITFVSNTDSVATIDNTGKVTAITKGETVIECVITSKPNLMAKAVVKVS